MNQTHAGFTKYEVARIIGARALQIAMDAPLLLKISEEELKKMRYDSIKIAERELEEGILPITIHRPTPKKRKDKLGTVKEDTADDEALAEREHAEEKEIKEDVEELGLVEGDETEDFVDEPVATGHTGTEEA